MSSAASPLAPAHTNNPKLALGCAIPFGLFFAIAGGVAFYFITLKPLLLVSASKSWIETPCEILSSELAVSSDSDGSTYRVAVSYRYAYQGRHYESDRYHFGSGSTNVGVSRMRATVASLPPGHRTVCYVNPAAPDSAVLSRRIPGVVWFGSFTLLFPLAGLGAIVAVWRGVRAKPAASPLAASSSHFTPTGGGLLPPNLPDPETPGEVLLKPATGRIAAFVGLGIFTLFWNGIVGVIAYNIISDFRDGGVIGWFFILFLLPFDGVGLLMLGLTAQAFSRLFAPPVEVRLDPSLLRLGARVPFTWRLGGGGVRKLTLRLVAREEATYQQGTSTTTDKADCHRSVLHESTDVLGLTEGRAELLLPEADAAPAFHAKNNRLVWELVVHGDIPWRADVNDTFLLPVRGPAHPPTLATAPEPRPHPGGGLTLWTVDRFAPGETLVFTLSRDASAAPGPLTVQLGWFTEGKGTRDAAVAWSDYLPDLAPGADRSFEVPLPAEPWSFTGTLVAVEWRLEVLDAARAPLVAVPLVIAPGGESIRLTALPAESALAKWKSFFRPTPR